MKAFPGLRLLPDAGDACRSLYANFFGINDGAFYDGGRNFFIFARSQGKNRRGNIKTRRRAAPTST
jgi:hypothetical protein